jgi:hypothetical protein
MSREVDGYEYDQAGNGDVPDWEELYPEEDKEDDDDEDDNE